ncbi:M48 family metalloprotease [Marivita sp.]|uniref:M48 family metalloprotease n=1 Tax=Marivita sp. TaxID=2003365 RepID=UPI0025C62916|nr:M48 family metalloprotease [Marivita sp.]
MVSGDFTGGAAIAILAENMLSASYTREAERAADAFSLALLKKANVSVDGFATYFQTLESETVGPELPEYLSAHPSTAGRGDAARAFAETQSRTEPIFASSEWRALRMIWA